MPGTRGANGSRCPKYTSVRWLSSSRNCGRGPHITVMNVTEQRLEGTCRAHRLLHGIEVERRTCLQDIAQVLGGNAHGMEFVATLWVLDIGGVDLEGFEPSSNGFPNLAIHIWSWDVSPRRLTDVH